MNMALQDCYPYFNGYQSTNQSNSSQVQENSDGNNLKSASSGTGFDTSSNNNFNNINNQTTNYLSQNINSKESSERIYSNNSNINYQNTYSSPNINKNFQSTNQTKIESSKVSNNSLASSTANSNLNNKNLESLTKADIYLKKRSNITSSNTQKNNQSNIKMTKSNLATNQESESSSNGTNEQSIGGTGSSHVYRRPWTTAEDAILLDYISKNGPGHWIKAANLIKSRTPKQCRERYHQNLKPTLNHNPITEEEGLIIEHLVSTLGRRWAAIARHLNNGRSENAIKSWWNSGVNRRKRANLSEMSKKSKQASNGVNLLSNQNGISNQFSNEKPQVTSNFALENSNNLPNQAQNVADFNNNYQFPGSSYQYRGVYDLFNKPEKVEASTSDQQDSGCHPAIVPSANGFQQPYSLSHNMLVNSYRNTNDQMQMGLSLPNAQFTNEAPPALVPQNNFLQNRHQYPPVYYDSKKGTGSGDNNWGNGPNNFIDAQSQSKQIGHFQQHQQQQHQDIPPVGLNNSPTNIVSNNSSYMYNNTCYPNNSSMMYKPVLPPTLSSMAGQSGSSLYNMGFQSAVRHSFSSQSQNLPPQQPSQKFVSDQQKYYLVQPFGYIPSQAGAQNSQVDYSQMSKEQVQMQNYISSLPSVSNMKSNIQKPQTLDNVLLPHTENNNMNMNNMNSINNINNMNNIGNINNNSINNINNMNNMGNINNNSINNISFNANGSVGGSRNNSIAAPVVLIPPINTNNNSMPVLSSNSYSTSNNNQSLNFDSHSENSPKAPAAGLNKNSFDTENCHQQKQVLNNPQRLNGIPSISVSSNVNDNKNNYDDMSSNNSNNNNNDTNGNNNTDDGSRKFSISSGSSVDSSPKTPPDCGFYGNGKQKSSQSPNMNCISSESGSSWGSYEKNITTNHRRDDKMKITNLLS